MEAIGWLGSLLLACCALPLAYTAWRDKVCYVNKWFMYMWTAGEVALLTYTVFGIRDTALAVNYGANLACCLVVLRYRRD